ncbi:MAG: glycoside hydrolase family 3 protein [Alphaproteobacteria bacterium]|nr:glycoside hydrolase family 3 protein [Alphaproteobacteria bacterium]
MNRKALALAALFGSVALCPAAYARQDAAAQPWRDPSLGVDRRAAALVSRMTLEEKAAQLGNFAPAIPRLEIPEYNWWSEGLHGVARAGVATVFPQAVGMAASWDQLLMHDVAGTIGVEFRAKYVERRHPDGGTDWYRGLTVWSPNINIFRDPRWGRGQETYGEDPYLTGRMGIAFIRGLQGDDPRYFQTIATSKHYAVHSGPESSRHRTDVHPSPHDLEDTYLPAFRATVTEANVQSVMCAYNAVDGIPACASPDLLQHRLRDAWGFKGYVVSDCGAAANIYRPDALHYTQTPEEGVAAGFKAGMDVICGDFRNNWTTEQGPIVAAVKRGLLPEAVIDTALRRLFSARIRLGMFDPPSRVFPGITPADNDTPAHRALALKMAQASMVLLRNRADLLPLRQAPRTIAVIGPNADSLDALIGNYYGTPSKPVTVLDGLRARFPRSEIVFVQGTGLIGPAEPPVPDSVLCVDADCRTHGLRAETFAGTNLQGAPTATSVEPNASFTWRGERESAIRWTGMLVPPATGDYRFRVLSQNGYRIWIGDILVTDEWGVGDAPSIASGKAALQAGRKYPIRVEAVQRGARGEQRLVWSMPAQSGDDAVEAARKADLVVFVGGLSARVEGEEMKVEAPGFAGGDRTSLDLPAPQERLLERVQATGKPLVLVLMNGSALGVNWADAHVPAIVEAWYPGEEGGTAIASLIAGDFSPAGRLPVTFYKSADQLPAFDDYSMARRTYRYFNGAPLYPFGYGLSYTSFRYANVRADAATVPASGEATISAEVTNSGGRDGDEVVQLYVSHPGVPGAPIRALQGFQRLHLKAGETRRVRFTLKDRALSIVDPQGRRRIEPGPVEIWVGGGQPVSRIGLPQPAGGRTRFRINGSAALPG